MLSLLILILMHLSLSSGPMPHHLMLQNQAPLTAWVVGNPYAGAFTQCLGLIWSSGEMHRTLIGRMQHLQAGLLSSHKRPKAQGSHPGSLVLS
jgi:hypothetical protein